VPGDQTPFFRNAARQTLALVASVLQKHQKSATRPWGMLDLAMIVSSKKMLRLVMFRDYEAKSFYQSTLGPNIKSSGDVYSTLRSVIQPLIRAALIEPEAKTRLNLKSFLRSDGVAVLGIPPTGPKRCCPCSTSSSAD
jgi:hypothetical protein